MALPSSNIGSFSSSSGGDLGEGTAGTELDDGPEGAWAPEGAGAPVSLTPRDTAVGLWLWV